MGNRSLVRRRGIICLRRAETQIPQKSIPKIVDPAMDHQRLSPLPAVTGNRGLAHIERLFDHIQLA